MERWGGDGLMKRWDDGAVERWGDGGRWSGGAMGNEAMGR